MILFFTQFAVKAQQVGAIINWTESRKLTLKDFKVVDDSSSVLRKDVAAITRTGVTYSLNASRGKKVADITMRVYATVHTANTYIKKSRLQIKPERIAYLLNHEQKHFDISEIYAREAARELTLAKATKNYRKEFSDIVKARFKEAEDFQKLYDKETDNGRNAEKQTEWDTLISEKLRSLEKYRKKIVHKRIVL